MKSLKLVIAAGLLFVTSLSFAQSTKKWGKNDADSVACLRNTSWYTEFYKQKNYQDAYTPWKTVLNTCPTNSENLYIRGNAILTALIGTETDAQKKEAYINELIELWDLRIRYFGKEADNLARKAYAIRTLKPQETELIYKTFADAFSKGKENLDPTLMVVYLQATVDYVKEGKDSVALILDTYDQISEALGKAKKNANEKDLSKIEDANGNIELLIEPYASCTDLIPILKKKFETDGDNAETLNKITTLLDRKKCTDDPLFLEATEKLHKINPSAESAYKMGRLYQIKKENDKAATYLQEAFNLYTEAADKARTALIIADMYTNSGNYSNARSWAYKSLEHQPNNGQAYILIGNLYAASSKLCGGDEIKDRAVFWVAVDKYAKAKAVDPSVAETANKYINQYSQYFPSQDNYFMHGLSKGQSYKVECWINETTTIR